MSCLYTFLTYLHGPLTEVVWLAMGAGGCRPNSHWGRAPHQGLQLQEVRLPQKVLRVLPGGHLLQPHLQMPGLQEL